MYRQKRIIVLIPAFNEEASVGKVIRSMPSCVDKVIVVNDGSTDRTAMVARENGAYVVNHSRNIGVGASFHTGMRKALEYEPDVMVNIDADGQFDPEDIIKLIEPIVSGEADFVTASRFIDPQHIPKMNKIKLIGNKIMSLFITKISGQKFYDVSCGFRAYNREALLKLNLFGEYTYTQETFLNLAIKNVRIKEVPVEVRGKREFGKSKVASNLFKYGYHTLKVILKTVRDYWPLKLFGFISFFCFLFSLGLAGFLFFHYLHAGSFSPHKWAGFTAGFFFIVSLLTLTLGFILEIFARMRLTQEEMLYYLKQLFFKK